MKTTENFLRKIILTGIFIVPFLAFFVPTSLFFPFITGKNFGFRIIVEIIFAAWILLAYYNESYRPKFSWMTGVATVFIGIIFLADLFGSSPSRSFWSNYERMEGFVGLIHTYAYFIVLGSVLTKDLWMRYFQTILATSALMSIYGFMQLGGMIEIDQSGARLDATFGNSAYLAVYMLFNLFLAAYFFARQKRKNGMRWVYGSVFVLDFIVLYYTATRGALLGLLVGIFVTAILVAFFETKNKAVQKYTFGTLAMLVILVGLFFAFKNTPFVEKSPVLGRLASISLHEPTTESRFMVWGMAIDGFKEHPILGWGQENFNLVFNKYYNPGMYAQEQWFDRAHDIFLDWLIATGILGLLAYLFFFVVAFVLIWRPGIKNETATFWEEIKNGFKYYKGGKDPGRVFENSIFTGLLVAYFIHNIFVFDNLFSYILFFSFLAFLHSRYILETSATKKPAFSQEKKFPVEYATAGVVVVFAIILYTVNVRPLLANISLINAIAPQDASGNISPVNISAFKTVFDYNTFGNQEAREQIVQSAVRAKSQKIDQGLASQLYDLARSQILLQVSEQPEDARSEVFAGMLFFNYGINDDALEHFGKAHELSPKKQTIDFNLVLTYIGKKQFDKALALAKEAYELETSNKDAAKIYAVAAIASRDQNLADDILTKNFGTTLLYDDNVINAYSIANRYDKIVATFKNQLEQTPDDSNLLMRLAGAYVETGDKNNAIATLQAVIKMNPDFKTQGEYYIKQIEAGKNP